MAPASGRSAQVSLSPGQAMNCDAWRFAEALPTRRQVGTQVLASGTGSIVVGLILTPVQVLKVRWQMQAEGRPGAAGVGGLAREIYGREGPLAFWRGFGAMLLMQAPSTAVYMVCYELLKDATTARIPSSAPATAALAVPVVSGTLARAVAASVFAPLELIRTNQAAGRGGTMAATAAAIVQSRGFAGLYAGLVPTLYRDVPFSGIYWLAFEQGKARLCASGLPGMRAPPVRRPGEGLPPDDPRLQPQPSSLAVLLAASVSGCAAALATHPFDTIKTRLQVAVTDRPVVLAGKGGAALGVKDLRPAVSAAAVFHEMGASIFYRGLGLRLMQIVPGTSAMMITYSLVKRAMGEPAL